MTDSTNIDMIRELCAEGTEAHGDEFYGPILAALEAYLDEPIGAGTNAHEMLAATETANIEITDTLMQMTAATVLSVLIDEEGGGRSNIHYSPKDMDSMNKRYEFTATRDGMITTVSISPRPGAFARNGEVLVSTMPGDAVIPAPESFYRDPGEPGPSKPQAEAHVYDRPLWAARIDGILQACADRTAAEEHVLRQPIGVTASVENRFCYHTDCPAERCNHVPKQDDAPEVTSGA